MYVIVLLRKYKTGNYRTFFPYVAERMKQKKMLQMLFSLWINKIRFEWQKIIFESLENVFPSS